MQQTLQLEYAPSWVVHVSNPYDVFIGRGRCPRRRIAGEWGNPFAHVASDLATWKVATVEEAVARHKEWFLAQPALVAKAKLELRGKILGCFCRAPKPCHGHILARVANE